MTISAHEAAAKSLEERLDGLVRVLRDKATCAICLDVYVNPHVILCKNECFQNVCRVRPRVHATLASPCSEREDGDGDEIEGDLISCPSCRATALAVCSVGQDPRVVPPHPVDVRDVRQDRDARPASAQERDRGDGAHKAEA